MRNSLPGCPEDRWSGSPLLHLHQISAVHPLPTFPHSHPCCLLCYFNPGASEVLMARQKILPPVWLSKACCFPTASPCRAPVNQNEPFVLRRGDEPLGEQGRLGPSGAAVTAPWADTPSNKNLCHFLAPGVCPRVINSDYGAIPFTSDSEHAD